MFNQNQDTIAAIATAPGEGGVAIIRISGPQAFETAQYIFSKSLKNLPPHTAHFGKMLNAQGEVLDEGLALLMYGPRSYTGEDTVELHCHGGSLITRRILENLLQVGARLAHPGEFTHRAFMNGKIDLAQAEAVQQLIGAKNDLALRAAQAQLQGALSQKIRSLQNELTDSAAILEAWVDFPEEGLEFASFDTVIEAIAQTQTKIEQLTLSYEEGKKLHEGLSLCLIGPPNAGKSSLMNALLGKNRAIVTAIPGTTRDLIEEQLVLGGLHVRLTDTAGIRISDEPIEREGIRRSHEAMEAADLILLVLDATVPISQAEQALLSQVSRLNTILVWNKIDLLSSPLDIPSLPTFFDQARVSAKNALGMEELKKQIERHIWRQGPPNKDELVLTSLRQKQTLSQASSALALVIKGLQEKVSAEFVSSDMRTALNALAQITGTDSSEEILNAIFSKFCLGK